MWRMLRCFNTPYLSKIDIGDKDKVTHVVVLPIFKEPVEVIINTIYSIAAQSITSSLVVVVGMEEKTSDQSKKRTIIERHFENKFKALVFSVHPYGLKGEIPGACPNRNYAARAAVKYMIREKLLKVDAVTNEIDINHTTLTVCDADTIFFPKYFENLTYEFLSEREDKRHEVCWQSPLFYNIALDKRWFFTRVMNILRSFFMVGFLIGCDINTMSIYSVSLRLLVKSKFFHPWYHMDDIIFNQLAMLSIKKRVRIRCLDVPTLSGPTSGVNFFEELKEWVIQGTRWTTGAAEVFHYLCVKLLKRNFFFPGFSYMLLFVYYYAFVLCVSGIAQISTLIMQLISIGVPSIGIEQCQPFSSWFGHHDFLYYDWILPAFLLST